jgi:hypothetical protein
MMRIAPVGNQGFDVAGRHPDPPVGTAGNAMSGVVGLLL